MQQECHLGESLYLTTEYVNITGEKKNSSTELIISTSLASTAASYSIYPSNGDFSESNVEYQEKKDSYTPNPLAPFLYLTPFRSLFGQKTIATLNIAKIDNQYWASRLSADDYLAFNSLISNDVSIKEVYSELQFASQGRPENREELYTAHPYQRLPPTEDDPYPLIQIHVE